MTRLAWAPKTAPNEAHPARFALNHHRGDPVQGEPPVGFVNLRSQEAVLLVPPAKGREPLVLHEFLAGLGDQPMFVAQSFRGEDTRGVHGFQKPFPAVQGRG